MKRLDKIFKMIAGLSATTVDISDEKINDDYIAFLRPSKYMDNLLIGYIDRTTINPKYITPANNIIVATNGEGSHSYSYVYPYEFVGNADTIVLIPQDEYKDMSFNEKQYYACAITFNRFRFCYGRKPKSQRLSQVLFPEPNEILIDTNKDLLDISSIPDYFLNDGYDNACMYIDKIDVKEFETDYKPPVSNIKISFNINDWKEFKVSNLFIISGTKDSNGAVLGVSNIGEKEYPQYNQGKTNQGIKEFLDYYTNYGNVIIISDIAPFCTYQEKNFIGYGHVHQLKPINFTLNQFIGIFIVTILKQEFFRYSYGRIFNKDRIKNTKIRLPICYEIDIIDGNAIYKVDESGNKIPQIDKSLDYHPEGYIPDFQFMEDYIKSLPFTKALKTENDDWSK